MREGLHIRIPEGTLIQATHNSLLPANGPLPSLSTDARRVSIFPGLTIKALISIGQFCDDGYSAVFTTHNVCLLKDDTFTVILIAPTDSVT